jgi:hypothetical protein
VDNDAFDSVDDFERTAIGALQWLRGLAPAAVENGVRGRNPRSGCGIFAFHDFDEDSYRGSGVASRQRAD